MTEHERYRRTDRTLDVGFVFGALGARRLPGPVLIGMLERLHLAESAARNTLSRMAHAGSLTGEHAGRVVLYELSTSVMEKYRQVDGSGEAAPWCGEYASLIYRAPESVRWFRDRLQYFAAYFGYGSLRPGVLVAVRDRSGELLARLGQVPAEVGMHRLALRPEGLEEARSIASAAWDLDELAGGYRRVDGLLTELLRTRPRLDAREDDLWEAFVTWNRIYREVIDLQVADPHLPLELLPADWPRPRHLARLAELNAQWGPVLTGFLREQAADADARGLAVYDPGVGG